MACEPGRSYGGDRGHLLQRGRKTRRRRETRLTRWDRGVSDGARVRSGRADDARAGPRDERVGLLCARRAGAECGAGLRAGKRFAGLSGEEGGSARVDCCCRWFVGRCACALSGSWLLRFAGEVVDGLCAWAGVASWVRAKRGVKRWLGLGHREREKRAGPGLSFGLGSLF